jgi:uroporphyrinogen decarboxylase
MTTKREVARTVLAGGKPPYVPWHCKFTREAREKLVAHFGSPAAVDRALDNHFVRLNCTSDYFQALPEDRVRDPFGVIWDRSRDKDIGIVEGQVLPEPDIGLLRLPSPEDPRLWGDPAAALERQGDGLRVFFVSFSLYERAWTLRGLDTFLLDLIAEPDFARALLEKIADFNMAMIERALRYDIDAVYFGDDWGDQRGVQMGPARWRALIKPVLARQYAAVRAAGKYVIIHSCGKVDELFGDLADIGVNCFNPFQPEVMDVAELLPRHRGRLSFHGGLSTQRTLPYGTVDDVRRETRALLDLGRDGGYIFAPAHAVEGDVPLENMLAFLDIVTAQAR